MTLLNVQQQRRLKDGNALLVTFTSLFQTGSGASGLAETDATGALTRVVLTSGGEGYLGMGTRVESIHDAAAPGTNLLGADAAAVEANRAKLSVTVARVGIAGAAVSSEGSGYVAAPHAHVSGVRASTSLSSTSLAVQTGGSTSVSTSDKATLSSPAQLEAVVVSGAVKRLVIVDAGEGYKLPTRPVTDAFCVLDASGGRTQPFAGPVTRWFKTR